MNAAEQPPADDHTEPPTAETLAARRRASRTGVDPDSTHPVDVARRDRRRPARTNVRNTR